MTVRRQVPYILLALVLCAWPLVTSFEQIAEVFSFLDLLPESIQIVLVPVLVSVMALFGLSFLFGTGILFFVLLKNLSAGRAKSHILYPLILPALCILWIGSQALPFLQVPAGASIRPMGWALYNIVGGFVLMLYSFSQTVIEYRGSRSKIASIAAFFLSFAIFLTPFFSLHSVARLKGFTLAP